MIMEPIFKHVLRDRPVCGIQHERIQQRLLSEGD